MEKTAMEMLLEFIDSFSMDYPASRNQIKKKATELLETEKKQMVDMYDKGRIESNYCHDSIMSGEEYFNNKFKK